jgi:hypothetical protein
MLSLFVTTITLLSIAANDGLYKAKQQEMPSALSVNLESNS